MCNVTIAPTTVVHTVTTSRLYDLWAKFHTVGCSADELGEVFDIIKEDAVANRYATREQALKNWLLKFCIENPNR